ncbi:MULTISPECIES: hypothetical protein [Clostridium]|uniref:DUF4825 domain-containing protein n=1 Tax=Clostridium aquiflavi TaxID=3073603 RepID=A0ABU1EK76_9CLOT|nr:MULTISPECIES: hypothetical protein [unclassified Clostridium]MDR5588795.1 hypothetical protein [Clostridium sp. 5N-1]
MNDETNMGNHKSNEENISKVADKKVTKTEGQITINENEKTIESGLQSNENGENYSNSPNEPSNENSHSENQQQKKLNKKNKKPLIAITCIIATVVLIIAIASFSIVNNPKVKVVKALKATNDELNSRKTFSEQVTGEKDFLNVYDKGLNQEMEMNMVSSNIEELQEAYGTGFKLTSAIDNDNKKALISLSAKYQGQDTGSFNVYTDNQKLMVKLPSIYSKWFMFDCENIQNQYNNSIFGQQGRMPNDEITLKMFEDDEIPTYNELKEVLVKGYLKSHENDLSQIADSIIVKKLDKSKEIMINGVNQKCKGYDVSISKNEIDKFLLSIYDYFENDTEARNILNRYFKNFNSISTVKNSDEMLDSFKSLEKFISYLKNDFSVNDISMKVYVDKKGRAVKTDFDTGINMKDDTLKINSSIEYKGKDNIGDDIDISMLFDNNGVQANADMNLKTINEESSTQNVFSGKITSHGETLGIDLNTKYDTESKKLNGEFKFGANGEEMTFAYNGKYDFNKENKYLKFDFDKINFNKNIANTNEYITLDFSYGRMPLNKPIEEPNEEKVEIFKIDQNKLVEIFLEIEQNTDKLKQTLNL